MNNQQLAHVWAQQEKTSGKGSSFFFEGATIYSYGRHFPIARYYEHKGKKCILFTSRGYSNSTAKHINYTRQAINRDAQPVFYVYDPSKTPSAEDLERYIKEAEQSMSLAERARSRKDFYTTEANGHIAQYHAFGKFFGIRTKKNPVDPKRVKELKARALESMKKDRERRKEREAIEKATLEELAQKWRAGEINETYRLRSLPVMLRANGDELQTSQGARVPLTDARTLYHHAKQFSIETVVKARPRIGEFHIDAYRDGNIIAGCHTIPWNEIERFFQS